MEDAEGTDVLKNIASQGALLRDLKDLKELIKITQ